MPEGDTIWRTARTLHAALAGKTVLAFASSLLAVAVASRRLGCRRPEVEAVEARGKHLLVRFAGGAVLHTHQGMRGSWRLQRRTGGAGPPVSTARAVIETADVVAVCTLAPVVEMLSRFAGRGPPGARPARSRPAGARPSTPPRPAAACARAATLPIGVALMDQTALAGIGNVYKSEVLFLCGVSPFARVRDLDDATIDRLVAKAGELLRRNLGPGLRRTTSALSPLRLWVYRRSRLPCRRCGTAIERVVQGEQARSTYFCPACQR